MQIFSCRRELEVAQALNRQVQTAQAGTGQSVQAGEVDQNLFSHRNSLAASGSGTRGFPTPATCLSTDSPTEDGQERQSISVLSPNGRPTQRHASKQKVSQLYRGELQELLLRLYHGVCVPRVPWTRSKGKHE